MMDVFRDMIKQQFGARFLRAQWELMFLYNQNTFIKKFETECYVF